MSPGNSMMVGMVMVVMLTEQTELLLFLLLTLFFATITVAISVAVTITVAISVAISVAITVITIAAFLLVDGIQHDTKIRELTISIELVNIEEQTLIGLTCPKHHDGGVGNTLDNIRVGNHTHRNIIEEDVFVTLTKFSNQIIQARTHQQLCRVRRHRTRENHIEIRRLSIGMDDVIDVIRLS